MRRSRCLKLVGTGISRANSEHADINGVEVVFDLTGNVIRSKISYSLSWAKGTSSYADEVYWRYYYENPDTTVVPPAEEFYLNFDQRHRIFIQCDAKLPYDTRFYVLGYFGNGFPYTPPGPEGKYDERNVFFFSFQKQIDCYLSKRIYLGRTSVKVFAEVLNLFNWENQISNIRTIIPLYWIKPENFRSSITILSPYYHPAADFNHDGLITAYEEYHAYLDYANATDESASNYKPLRRIRVGISIGL